MTDFHYTTIQLQKFVHDPHGVAILESYAQQQPNVSLNDAVRLVRSLNKLSQTDLTTDDAGVLQSGYLDKLERFVKERTIDTTRIKKSLSAKGSTRHEKLVMGVLFALNALAVCTSCLPIIKAGIGGVLPFMAMFLVGYLDPRSNNKYAFKDTVPASEVCREPESALKLTLIQKDIEEAAIALNIPPPEIVFSDKGFISAGRKNGRTYVFYRPDAFQDMPYHLLKPVTFHELGHNAQRHVTKTNVFSSVGLANLGQAVMTGLYCFYAALPDLALTNLLVPAGVFLNALVPFVLSGVLARQHELQADRIGAVLDGSPENLIEYFHGEPVEPEPFFSRMKPANAIARVLWKTAETAFSKTALPVLSFLFEKQPAEDVRTRRLENMRLQQGAQNRTAPSL